MNVQRERIEVECFGIWPFDPVVEVVRGSEYANVEDVHTSHDDSSCRRAKRVYVLNDLSICSRLVVCHDGIHDLSLMMSCPLVHNS